MQLKLQQSLYTFDRPLVMGILNLTPDSFFDGGRYNDLDAAMAQADRMVAEGVDILDLGAQSSRPGATPLGADEELSRLLPVVDALRAKYPTLPLSIDTYHAEVAEQCLLRGAAMINDISAGDLDDAMIAVVKRHQAAYCIMHMQGRPSTMQDAPQYEDVSIEVYQYLQAKLTRLQQAGINDVIIDPGFGFGKTIEHNYQLLGNLHFFAQLNCPVLVGISRKSMLYKVLDCGPEDVLPATSAAHTIAIQKGAHILRVHDVAAAHQVIKVCSL